MRMKKAFEDYMAGYDDFVKERGEEYDAVLEEYRSLKDSSKPSLQTDKKLDTLDSKLESLRKCTEHGKEYGIRKNVSVKMYTSMDFDCVFVYPLIMKTGDSYPSRGEIDLKERDGGIRTILGENGFLPKGSRTSSSGDRIYSMNFANDKGDIIEVGYDSLHMPKDKRYSSLAQELFKIYTDKKKPAKKAKRNEGSFSMTSSDIEDVIRNTEKKFDPNNYYDTEKDETTCNDLIDMTKKVYETEIKDKINEADKAVSDMIKKGELDKGYEGLMGMLKDMLDLRMDLLEKEKSDRERGKKRVKK